MYDIVVLVYRRVFPYGDSTSGSGQCVWAGIVAGCTLTGIVKLDQVEGAADFLIEIMPVMFIPAAVGLLNAWDVLRPVVVPVVVVTVATTVLVMGVTGQVTQRVIRWERKRKEGKEK